MDSIYDRALSEAKNNGPFQIKFDILFNIVLMILWAMAYMNIILVLTVVPHTCQLPGKPANYSEELWKLKYIPKYIDADGELKFSSCQIFDNPDESNETRACTEFTYDRTWYESTVASENNWVCEKELNVANVFAYSRIGELIGSLVFGWFGDMYGRRLTYIISLALIIIGRLFSIIFSYSFIAFLIGSVLASFPSWSVVQSTTLISIEISSPERRSIIASLRFIAWSCGVTLMPFVYWWLKDWKWFTAVTTCALLPYLCFSWYILESPRWLWVSGKNKKCVNALKRIAKSNNKALDENTIQELLTSKSEGNLEVLGFLSLFSGWILALNTILQSLLWICVTLSYTVLLMSSGEKYDGNPFLEFAWQAVVEVPGHFTGAWLANRIGRRYAGTSAFVLMAILWALTAFRKAQSGNVLFTYQWISSGIVVLNRFATTVSYYVLNLFGMELYPTCLRQSGLSLGNLISSGASAIAPYILYIGRRVDPRFPGILLSIVSGFGVVFCLLLPETNNKNLPETLEDANNFSNVNNIKNIFSRLRKPKTKTENIQLNSLTT